MGQWNSAIFKEWGTSGNQSARALSKPGDSHPKDHKLFNQTSNREDAANYQKNPLYYHSLFNKPDPSKSAKQQIADTQVNSAREHMKFFHGKRADSMNQDYSKTGSIPKNRIITADANFLNAAQQPKKVHG